MEVFDIEAVDEELKRVDLHLKKVENKLKEKKARKVVRDNATVVNDNHFRVKVTVMLIILRRKEKESLEGGVCNHNQKEQGKGRGKEIIQHFWIH